MSTHPPSFSRIWLPALIGGGWLAVCYVLVMVFSAPAPRSEPDPTAGADLASEHAAPDTARDTFSARLEIRDTRADRITGWIDLAVTGDGVEAEAACQALVKREQGLTYPAPLAIRPATACTSEDLPDQPAGVQAGVGLFQPMPLTRLDVALAGGGRAESLTRLRSVTVGHFDDRASCQRALDALTDRQAMTAGRARLDANAILDDQIATWRDRVAQACRTGGSDRECATGQALLARLEARRASSSPDHQAGDEDLTPTCRNLRQ